MSVTQQQPVPRTGTSAVPSESAPPPPVPMGPKEPQKSDWGEFVKRLRGTALTEPGRLRIIGAAVAALLFTFGAVTSWQMSSRAESTDAVIHGSQPLSRDAALIYRSLADANTTAASGFLAGGNESEEVRTRYEDDIKTASRLITEAAARSKGSDNAQEQLVILNKELPSYTGFVESARANNRQGLPVGGAYLRHADEQMRTTLLPAASALYEAETEQLAQDHQDARSLPWLSLLLGAAAIALLVWAQRRHYQRTNRVFNQGLVAASTAAVLLLLWVMGGQLLARHHLDQADQTGGRSLQALNSALVAALEAKGDEGMSLVTRGAGADYEDGYEKSMTKLAGKDPESEEGGLLYEALELADSEEGRVPLRSALRNAGFWDYRHSEVRAMENSGDYSAAVAMVIGSRGTTGETFDKVDGGLRKAIKHEQKQFTKAANRGRGALNALPTGAMVLVLLGAAGAVVGISRRLTEYR